MRRTEVLQEVALPTSNTPPATRGMVLSSYSGGENETLAAALRALSTKSGQLHRSRWPLSRRPGGLARPDTVRPRGRPRVTAERSPADPPGREEPRVVGAVAPVSGVERLPRLDECPAWSHGAFVPERDAHFASAGRQGHRLARVEALPVGRRPPAGRIDEPPFAALGP